VTGRLRSPFFLRPLPSFNSSRSQRIFRRADLKKVSSGTRALETARGHAVVRRRKCTGASRAQHDSFLPVMEDGTVVLSAQPPIIHRSSSCRVTVRGRAVLCVNPLDGAAVEKLLRRQRTSIKSRCRLMRRSRARVKSHGGRRRPRCATLAEEGLGAQARSVYRFRFPEFAEVVHGARQSTTNRRRHYNLISGAAISVRGSDPDASLYISAACVDCRRGSALSGTAGGCHAIEDSYTARSAALVVKTAAKDAYDFSLSPEGELATPRPWI